MGAYQTELEAKIEKHPFNVVKMREAVDEYKTKQKLIQINEAHESDFFKSICQQIQDAASNHGESWIYIYPQPDSYYSDFDKKHPNVLNVDLKGVSFNLSQRKTLDVFSILGYLVTYEQSTPHERFPQYRVTKCMIRW